MSRRFTILYVDDEPGNLSAFRITFRRDYNILLAENAEEGLRLFEQEEVDLVLSDQRMPGMSGVQFLERVSEINPGPCRILVTAYSDIDAIQQAVNRASIFKYVRKPWDTEKLSKTIEQALEVYGLRKMNRALNDELSDKNKALEEANFTLRESDQLKYDFLRIISHEMRTPLNGLRGAAQLLKINTDKEPTSQNKELVTIVESSTHRLEQFLLLAERITSLKAKRYKLELQETDIARLIRNAVSTIASELEQNQQSVNYELCPYTHTLADSQLLSICVREILNNAVRHSPQRGEITIRTHSAHEKLAIEVSDQGTGFPEPVLRNLFKIFIREDIGQDRGLGLNLALTKLVMDLHGGTALAYNNPKGGATVRLSLKHELAAARSSTNAGGIPAPQA
ncbi:hybrid sensor histidine kinase/response regulator [Pelagicoccus sp. SDUM812002]|uniref:hybrid sensor histidine kinase/response regulator n=1 Tax=Pelagicoccus sp. SDUM812002 TaxID=3041266 RepID=UPI00280D361A|nr:hybrid sensor histidine kinase/response regulator [Pelagicoccus sp. SDUM812002]MDQ8186563.1 hybrid sensor histidine kinase/response regulator [Pelagicoccus sp. SDUM812002]